MATISLPSPHEPFVDLKTGKITDIWYRYLFKNVTEVTTVELTATAPLSISTANVVSISTASQTAQEAGASTSVVTPNVQQYHPSAAKAWGYVTLAGTVATLAAGYGVNAVASTALGFLRVDLTNAFSSTSYVVVPGNVEADNGATNRAVSVLSTLGLATTSFTLINQSGNTGNNSDPAAYTFVCYGDQ